DEGDRRLGESNEGLDFETPYAMDDARRGFEVFQQRMGARRLVFETEVGIMHRTFDTAFEAHAQEIGQSKILSLHAPFVVEAGFVRRDNTAAVFHERPELIALGIRERGNIRQDEGLERSETRGVEQTVVDHLERDARLDKRL